MKAYVVSKNIVKHEKLELVKENNEGWLALMSQIDEASWGLVMITIFHFFAKTFGDLLILFSFVWAQI
jgi:hypothetical protein